MENGAIFYKVRVDSRPKLRIESMPLIGRLASAVINIFTTDWDSWERETLKKDSFVAAQQILEAEKAAAAQDRQDVRKVNIVAY